MFWLQLWYFLCLQNWTVSNKLKKVLTKTSVSLYLWKSFIFHFSILYIFFYIQLAFVFHLQEVFYNVCNHTAYFCFWFLWNNLNACHIFFLFYFIFLKPFFDNFSRWIFRYFYISEKKLYEKLVLKKWLELFYCIITVRFLFSLHNT